MSKVWDLMWLHKVPDVGASRNIRQTSFLALEFDITGRNLGKSFTSVRCADQKDLDGLISHSVFSHYHTIPPMSLV